MAPVTVNRRLTAPDHFQAVHHIELDISAAGMEYQPGDLLCIFPRASPDCVDAFLQRIGLGLGTLFSACQF